MFRIRRSSQIQFVSCQILLDLRVCNRRSAGINQIYFFLYNIYRINFIVLRQQNRIGQTHVSGSRYGKRISFIHSYAAHQNLLLQSFIAFIELTVFNKIWYWIAFTHFIIWGSVVQGDNLFSAIFTKPAYSSCTFLQHLPLRSSDI